MPVPAKTSTLDPLALLDAVRTVAEASGEPVPERLSTRRWDAARPLSEKFVGAPTARRICELLGRGGLGFASSRSSRRVRS